MPVILVVPSSILRAHFVTIGFSELCRMSTAHVWCMYIESAKCSCWFFNNILQKNSNKLIGQTHISTNACSTLYIPRLMSGGRDYSHPHSLSQKPAWSMYSAKWMNKWIIVLCIPIHIILYISTYIIYIKSTYNVDVITPSISIYCENYEDSWCWTSASSKLLNLETVPKYSK